MPVAPVASRTVAFGGVTLLVEYTAGRAADLVDFLFDRVPRGDEASVPVASFRLAEDPDRGVFTLSSGGDVRCVDDVPGAVASWLLHLACRQFAVAESDALLLHAAAVAWRGRGMLLAGASGSGKTTVTALLAARGFSHLTDELVCVPRASRSMTGLSVPLKLKIPGVAALERTLALHPDAPGVVAGRYDLLFSPRGARAPRRVVPVDAIVFPSYRPDGPFRIEPLSPAQAALRLLSGVVNGDRLHDRGFAGVARVAGAADGYEMSYGSVGQVEGHLDTIREMTMRRSASMLPASTV